ncbi:MAG TPA: glutamate racemase [Candidatus Coprenecus pullistercoris]|nr:glutamate racemase [Candidatus Coprenecus pullistercoris]
MIGVYDSGVGGLSVWKELVALMPAQDYVYVADSAHCPYGDKSREYVARRADTVVRFMIEKGVEAVVVACNTATAAAIAELRSAYSIPFIGMEPAVKPAVNISHTGVVGVLATANTFRGTLYRDTVMRYASGIKVIEKVGKGLVEAVERGVVPKDLIKEYVGEMTDQGADVIVLGCTHFPFLSEEIARCAGPSVRIINPAPAVARQAVRMLDGRVFGGGTRKFYSTGDTAVLRGLAIGIDSSLTPDDFEKVSV